ncbi:MAG TPA: Uma2 family endonuclease [Pyrinomonadaceae bacterium]|nr:Uma2 family endonuclease [Pyrinomonadaceae bacterium]
MNVVTEPKTKVRRRFRNVESFEKWAYQQEFGYEFVHGEVIKKSMIKDVELIIIWWLTEFFYKTKSHLEGGRLISEVGMRLATENFRIPDLAYFTAAQTFAAAKGEHPIPSLAIEFLSKSESGEDIAAKVNDYFKSGVKLVWYIYPKNELIYAYTSPKDVKIYEGADVCSASPVIPDFEFQTKNIFKKELSL